MSGAPEVPVGTPDVVVLDVCGASRAGAQRDAAAPQVRQRQSREQTSAARWPASCSARLGAAGRTDPGSKGVRCGRGCAALSRGPSAGAAASIGSWGRVGAWSTVQPHPHDRSQTHSGQHVAQAVVAAPPAHHTVAAGARPGHSNAAI